MKRLLISGYRSSDLGIFSNQDPKLIIIKTLIKDRLVNFLDNDGEWLITGGQMGIEQWSIEVALELKNDYPQLKIALIRPFLDFGGHWNEDNQAKLAQLISVVDYSASISNQNYTNPGQLVGLNDFFVSHTDEAVLFYDQENPAKVEFLYQKILTKQSQDENYQVEIIDFWTLADFADGLNDDFID